MIELAARRIEVRRERVGLAEEGLRGVNPSPATVDEAVTRLREVEGRTQGFYAAGNGSGSTPVTGETTTIAAGGLGAGSKQARLEKIREGLAGRKVWREGRLVARMEPELKTHTSYLVFAVLPREWTREDEEAARERWGGKGGAGGGAGGGWENVSRRQMKRAARGGEGGSKGEVEKEEVGMEV